MPKTLRIALVTSSKSPRTNVEEMSKDDGCWAVLENMTKMFYSTRLKRDRFMCGRDLNSDYVLETQAIPEDMLRHFSRKHFILERRRDGDDFDVFIHDKSLTGTFVNGILVGYNKSVPIGHNDIISMRAKELDAFRLLLLDESDVVGDQRVNVSALPFEIREKYIVGQKIGSGLCGHVYSGRRRDHSARKVALKVVVKDESMNYMDVFNEVDILNKLDHPCIIKVEDDVFENDTHVVIVLEYVNGGELLDFVNRIFDGGFVKERFAKMLFYQILSAVQYIHSRNVSHRDLKLENVLMADTSPNCCRIKIIDFGFSKYASEAEETMTSFVGTLPYMAPEVLTNAMIGYSNKVDMWSLGCILYGILSGMAPFSGENRHKLASNIHYRGYSMTGPAWNRVSEEAKDLVYNLLLESENRRFSAEQALGHKWYADDSDVVKAAEVLISGGHIDAWQISKDVSSKRGHMGGKRKASPDAEKQECKVARLAR